MPSTSRVLNAEVIFNVALDAAKSMTAPLRDGGQRAALVSVIFAAVSLEAFLNELIELAQDFSLYDDEPSIVLSFASLMSDIEKIQGSVETRFNVAHWMFVGRGYDKSASPFQDFKLLFQVRNDVMHFKPDPLREEVAQEPTPRITEKLRDRNILNTSSAPDSSRSWVQTLGTRGVAEWACNTASLVSADMVAKMPASRWRKATEEVTQTIRTVHFGDRLSR